jgi:hypothetical protein
MQNNLIKYTAKWTEIKYNKLENAVTDGSL